MSGPTDSPTEQYAAPKATGRWIKFGYILMVLSVPALAEIFFEVVLLTLSSGPQMLFYSIIHTVGGLLGIVLAVSLVSNLLFAIYALGLLVFRALGKLAEPGVHFRVMMGCFAFQATVIFLMVTYESWTRALFY